MLEGQTYNGVSGARAPARRRRRRHRAAARLPPPPGVQAVTRRCIRKDAMMRSKFASCSAAAALAGCQPCRPTTGPTAASQSVNVPVVTAPTTRSTLPLPAARLPRRKRRGSTTGSVRSSWATAIPIYVDGPYSDAARDDVARDRRSITACSLSQGAPVTAGRSRRVRSGWSSAARAPRCRTAPIGASRRSPISTTARMSELRLRGEQQPRRHGRQSRGSGPRPRRRS